MVDQRKLAETLIGRAAAQFPVLKGQNYGLVNTPIPGDNRMLEFWPPDEPGGGGYERPAGLPMGQPGVQVISPDTQPSDVAADVISHGMVNTDPAMKGMYGQFAQTFQSPEMQGRLKQDYEWAMKNEGEVRPFDQWLQTTRIPDYMRGYVFNQWPEEAKAKAYSPDQRAILDQMAAYISQARGR